MGLRRRQEQLNDKVSSSSNGHYDVGNGRPNGATTMTQGSQEDSTLNPPTPIGCTHVYLIIWCFHMLVPPAEIVFFGSGHGGLDLRPLVDWDLLLLLPLTTFILGIYLLLLLSPPGKEGDPGANQTSRFILKIALGAHVLDIFIKIGRMPYVWDHEYWAMLTNLSFIICFVGPTVMGGEEFTRKEAVTSLQQAETTFLWLFRIQFGFFYSAATFWKLNTSFLHNQSSCGSVLFLELFGSYLPMKLPSEAVNLIVMVAPKSTLILEGLLGAGMFAASTAATTGQSSAKHRPTTIVLIRNLTVLAGVAFHMAIFLLPVNSAGGFSLDCMTRFILFFESDEVASIVVHPIMDDWQRQSKRKKGGTSSPALHVVMGITILTTAFLILLRWVAVGAAIDVGFIMASLLCVVYGWLMTMTTKPPMTKATEARVPPANGGQPVLQRPPVPWWTSLCAFSVLLLSACYAFVFPILGVLQMGAPTMYSNMRYYYGGNHLLVPTAVLGDDVLFGGRLVEVVHSTSQALNQRLAYMRSEDVFPPSVLQYMQQSLREPGNDGFFPMQMFPVCLSNPHSRELLKDLYVESNPPGSAAFTPFILPLNEVKKALDESYDNGETFVVKLADAGTSSERRRTDVSSPVYVLDQYGSCQVRTSGTSQLRGTECASHPSQLGPMLLRRAPTSVYAPVVEKLLIPFPELVGMEEEICLS